MSLAWSYLNLGACGCTCRVNCSLLCEWIIWSPYLRFWPETQLTVSPSVDLTFNNEIIFFYDPYEQDRNSTTSKTLLTDMENDATKTVHSFLCMSVKGERGTAKVEILHCSMRHLLRNTTVCFTRKKVALKVTTYCILVATDFKQGLFFLCWFVSSGGKSLYRLPMISKAHLLGLKRNKTRSHSSKYRVYPFTKEGTGVFRDLANMKDVKNPPQQT